MTRLVNIMDMQLTTHSVITNESVITKNQLPHKLQNLLQQTHREYIPIGDTSKINWASACKLEDLHFFAKKKKVQE